MLIRANDVDLFYTKTGSGHPLVMLHGNSQSHEIFGTAIAELSKYYTVYAIDSRCHGQSTHTETISYQLMANDIIAFIEALYLKRPYLYGFSDGAVVGLLVASQRPQLLGKQVLSGATTSANGMKKGWRLLFRLSYFFRRDRLFQMVLTQPAIQKAELEKIAVPTLLLFGEKDLATQEDIEYMASSIPGSTLRILPKEGHMSYVDNSPKLFPLLYSFLAETP